MHFNSLDELSSALTDEYAEKGIDQLVFGDGPVPCRIFIAGEAPGADEIKTGKPFTGQAGKNFDSFLEILRLTRDDIYIGNTCKFRPFKVSPKGTISNRPPTKKEIQAAMPYLHEEIRLVDPEIIITLGNTPLHACTEDFGLNIGAVHGRAMNEPMFQGIPIFPLYHPASIIYAPRLKETYTEDLVALREYLDCIGIHHRKER